MKLSRDETILLALYSEWMSDSRDYRRVNPCNMKMTDEQFVLSLMRLKDLGYIKGAYWQPDDALNPEEIKVLSIDRLSPSEKGIERAMEIAGTGKKLSLDAMKIVGGIFRDIGLAAFTNMLIQ